MSRFLVAPVVLLVLADWGAEPTESTAEPTAAATPTAEAGCVDGFDIDGAPICTTSDYPA